MFIVYQTQDSPTSLRGCWARYKSIREEQLKKKNEFLTSSAEKKV